MSQFVFFNAETAAVLRITTGAAPDEIEAGASMAELGDAEIPTRPSPHHRLAWISQALAWVDVRDLAQMIADASAPILAELSSLDAELVRPLGEVMEAMVGATTPAPAAVARLQAINADKAALRIRLAAINACATVEELLALLASG